MTGVNKTSEERMGIERFRFELRVELHRDVPRMGRELDDLDELPVERSADDLKTVIGQRFFIQAIEFVSMAMAFVDDRLAVQLMRSGSGLQFAGIRSQPHGPAKIVDAK